MATATGSNNLQAELEREKAALEGQLSAREDLEEQLRQQLSNKDDEIKERDERVEILEEQLRIEKNLLSTLSQEHASSRLQNNIAEELKKLVADKESGTAEEDDEGDQKFEDILRQKVVALESENEALYENVEQREQQIRAKQDELDQMRNVELNRLKEDIKALKNTDESNTKQIRHLNDQIEAQKAVQDKLNSQLQVEKGLFGQENLKKEKEEQRAKHAEAKVQEATEDNEKLQTEIKKLNDKVDLLQKDLDISKDESDQLRTVTMQQLNKEKETLAEELQATNKRMQEETSKLEQQLKKLTEEHKNEAGKNDFLNERVTELQSKIDEEQLETQNERSKGAKQGQEFISMQLKKQHFEGQVEILEKKLSTLQAECDELKLQKVKAEEKMNDKEMLDVQSQARRLKDLEKDLEIKTIELEKTMERYNNIDEERSKVKQELAEANTRIQAEQTKIKDMELDLVAKKKDLEEVRRLDQVKAIQLEKRGERMKLFQDMIQELKQQKTAKDGSLEELKFELARLQDIELKKYGVESEQAQAEVQRLTNEVVGRDDRIGLLTEQLEGRKEELITVKVELSKALEKYETLEKGELQARTGQLEISEAKLRSSELAFEEQSERLRIQTDRVKSQQEELAVRLEQLRLIYEKVKTGEVEVKLNQERILMLESQLATEKGVNQQLNEMNHRLEQRSHAKAGEAREKMRGLVEKEEALKTLEAQLDQREEQLVLLSDEVKSSDIRLEGKEERMALLNFRMKAATDDIRTKEERLFVLQQKLQVLEGNYQTKCCEIQLMTIELEASKRDQEEKIAQWQAGQEEVFKMQIELDGKEERIKLLNHRLAIAREDMQVQLELLTEDMRNNEIKMEAREQQFDLLMEGLQPREDEIDNTVNLIQQQLQGCRHLVNSKDTLLRSINRKLEVTVANLQDSESSLIDMRRQVAHAEATKMDVVKELAQLTEQQSTIEEDLSHANHVLDKYRAGLVTAEVELQERELKIKELTEILSTMQYEMHMSTGTGAMNMIAKSRVHFLYFMCAALLVKISLSTHAFMRNLTINQLFEEVCNVEVPLEEWPTYIFARLYASNHDSKTTPAGEPIPADPKRMVYKMIQQPVGAA